MIRAVQNGDLLIMHATNMRLHEDNFATKPDYGWFVQPQTAFRGGQGSTKMAFMGSIRIVAGSPTFVAFDPPIVSNLER